MEIDRELLEGCLKDMKFAHKHLVSMSEVFRIPVFIPASMLSLRIIELQEVLK